MKAKTHLIMKVEWESTLHSWYRIDKTRDLNRVCSLFRGYKGFRYAKLYRYDKRTKTVGQQAGWFNLNKFSYEG